MTSLKILFFLTVSPVAATMPVRIIESSVVKYFELPDKINPSQLADQGARIEGRLELSNMSRLVEFLSSIQGSADFCLQFGRDSGGTRFIHSEIAANLMLKCQRCGQPVQVACELKADLSPVLTDSQAKQLQTDYEPLVTQGEPVSLLEMVEDELVLNLPMIAKHDYGECPQELPAYLN